MKLQQLRYLCTIADEGFSFTRAGQKLHTTQPGISKQIRELEAELGGPVLVRRRNRGVGLTALGAAILPTARRMLSEAEAIRVMAADGVESGGQLVIATTHVHAQYTLLPAINELKRRHARVRVHLLQGSPAEIAYWVSSAEADIGFGAAALDRVQGLVSVPCFRVPHCLVAPSGHPLVRHARPALSLIARYPLITTGQGDRLGGMIDQRFASQGLHPYIAMRAPNIEIIKTYVRAGHGVAILPTIAAGGVGLRAIDVSHAIEPTIAVAVTRDHMEERLHVQTLMTLLTQKRGKARGIPPLTAATLKRLSARA